MANIEMVEMARRLGIEKLEKYQQAGHALAKVLIAEGCSPEEMKMFASPDCVALRSMVITNVRSRIENAAAASAPLSFGS